nr:hypothetical protein [Ktedonobacteraceae bacterium]
MDSETPGTPCSPYVPFSLLFARITVPVHAGEQTVGAKTETQTSLDGVVRTDSEEDEDVDESVYVPV